MKCPRFIATLAVCLAVVGTCNLVRGEAIAISNFDNNHEGWVGVELPFGTVVPPYTVLNTAVPEWMSTGGNPTGFIQNSVNIHSTFYWSAPSKFLGDVAHAYGQSLSFDLFDTEAAGTFDVEDIIRIGESRIVVFDLSTDPGPEWASFSVSLDETGWRSNNLSGPAATQADMLAVLGDLRSLYPIVA